MTSIAIVYHIYAFILFFIALAGFVRHRQNLITLLICLELMLLAVNTNLVTFSRFGGAIDGQVLVFFIMTVAAAEAAIGLALLVLIYRDFGDINLKNIQN